MRAETRWKNWLRSLPDYPLRDLKRASSCTCPSRCSLPRYDICENDGGVWVVTDLKTGAEVGYKSSEGHAISFVAMLTRHTQNAYIDAPSGARSA